MPSIKDLKKRISTVKNTQQTTRAMKMVSASKLRRAQEAIQSHRPYARRIGELILKLLMMPEVKLESPLIRREQASGPGEEKRKVLLVLITSDRGLCGAFNGNVIKRAQRWIRENQEVYSEIQLGFVGRKGYDFFKTKRVVLGSYYVELSGKVTFLKAKKLSTLVSEAYLSGRVDEVKFIYNEFKNAATQKAVIENFLPLQGAWSGGIEKSSQEEGAIYLIKPNAQAVLRGLLSKHFSVQAFRVLLESQASEHGARMSAMENATKNAGEMIRKLTLQFNKQRQAGITKELLEIIAGSESQKSA